MSNICLICYIDFSQNLPKKTLPKCNASYCGDCLTHWALEQIAISEPLDISKDKIKCPHNTCTHKIELSEYMTLLTPPQKVQIYDLMAKKYCQSASDVRCCPDPKCNNYGFLSHKACDDLVKCSSCSREWEDVSQYTFFKKMQVGIRNMIYKRNEFSSNVFEEVFTNLCPKCDVHIQKNGGCMHMTCAKCKFEFCWMCKQSWRNHSPALCGGCFVSFVMTCLLLVFLFFNKLGVFSPVFHFVWFILKYLFRNFIFNNMFFFSVGYFICNFSSMRACRRNNMYRSTLNFYFPLIVCFILAILMLAWMIFQGTLMECLYFGMLEGVTVGGGVATVLMGAGIWENWMSLVY